MAIINGSDGKEYSGSVVTWWLVSTVAAVVGLLLIGLSVIWGWPPLPRQVGATLCVLALPIFVVTTIIA